MICICGNHHTGHTACPVPESYEDCPDCELRLKTSWFGEPPLCPKHRKRKERRIYG